MRIVSWNINSVRLRANLVCRLIDRLAPDVICLQETKCPNEAFPDKAFAKKGFVHSTKNGIKGYHGVAILTRRPPRSTQHIDFCGKQDGRHICVEMPYGRHSIAIHNFYVPAGGDVPDAKTNDKFAHKFQFLREMTALFAKNKKHNTRLVLAGDFNIAPFEQDVWSSKQLQDVVSHTPIERAALAKLLAVRKFDDVARRFIPPEQKLYSWWSYRARDWKASDRGRRLDHIWVSPALSDAVTHYEVFKRARGWTRPSDHAPILIDLA